MKWYFGYNQDTERTQFPLVQMALFTALKNTSLEPHCIISGSPSPCSEWLEQRGVRVHFRDTQILSELMTYKAANPGYDINSAKGAYLRFEIPLIEAEDKYVLYTDTDVMFNSINYLELLFLRPKILAMAPEFDKKVWKSPNSGVMIINVPAIRRYIQQLYYYVLDNLPDLKAHDQTALTNFFKNRWDRLPTKYNWKPYWGYSPAAKIVHWHGPKPAHVEAVFRGETINDTYNELVSMDHDSYAIYIKIAREIMRKACIPEDFEPERYVSLYPDLMAAAVDGTEHYMCHGFYERRRWR
jgi:hypothetical protein